MLVIVIIAVAFRATSGVVTVADEFLQAVGTDDLTTAQSYLSADFQASPPPGQLEAFLEQTALADYESASWGSRMISGATGELEGTVHTHQGGAVPVEFTFVKEDDGWKIQSIEKAQAGLVEATAEEEGETVGQVTTGKEGGDFSKYNTFSPSIPDAPALASLVDATMHDFAVAVNARDFTGFHQKICTLWQEQATPEELLGNFESFADQDIDLTVLESLKPEFAQPVRIDERTDMLLLKGSYPTQPSTTYFDLGYLNEDGAWKLASIEVNVASDDPQAD